MKKKQIILIRGLGNGPKKFDVLRNKLKKYFEFYDFNPRYRQYTTAEISKNLEEFIKNNDLKKYSFVTHSFGGIIARYFLSKHMLENVKVVMTGTPNNGSELLCKTIKKIPFMAKILGKPSLEFCENKNKLLKHPRNCEYCIILGTKEFEPKRLESYVSVFLWDGRGSDGKVKIHEGKYKKEKFHLVDEYHSFIPEHPYTIKIIKKFLL